MRCRRWAGIGVPLTLWILFVVLSLQSFAEQAPAQAQGDAAVEFHRDIQPILTANCVGCHSGPTANAQLHLDSFQGVMHGGTSGPVIVPGAADKSVLLTRVEDRGNNRMPPGGQLAPEQIALVRAWVNQGARGAASIAFAEQVEPIFRTSCYSCHSGLEPRAGLRLDDKNLALKGGVSGLAVVPGNSKDSLLIHRVRGANGKARMPLVGTSLTPEQITTLETWIDQGAVWPDAQRKIHWAYAKPERPVLPAVNDAAWVRNAIDRFVLARLEKEGLKPSPSAAPEKLLRRVYLDLIGLPPTLQEMNEFLSDTRPDAYERLVDKLLASPHFGERMATPWLDLARYGDSDGYEKDRRRVAWPYRNWVIQAFNDNKPFDRFTIEQLAGDLLPNATVDQKVATGFVRASLLNTEGGTDPEEQNWVAQLDRVQTLGTTFLGSTVQCSQCHNHKYDPFTQKNFYQLMAFFNNAKFETRNGRGFQEPTLELPSPEQAIARDALKAQIEVLTKQLLADTPENRRAEAAWEQSLLEADKAWTPLRPTRVASEGGATLIAAEDGSVLASGKTPDQDRYVLEAKAPVEGLMTGLRLEALPDPSLPQQGPGRDAYGNFYTNGVLVELAPSLTQLRAVPVKEFLADNARTVEREVLSVLFKDERGDQIWRSDAIRESIRLPISAVLVFEKPVAVRANDVLKVTVSQVSPYRGVTLGRFRVSVTTSTTPTKLLDVSHRQRPLLTLSRAERAPFMKKLLTVSARDVNLPQAALEADDPLAAQWREVGAELASIREKIAGLQAQIDDLKIPSTLMLSENSDVKRPTAWVRDRGSFVSRVEEVSADVPAFLGPLPENAPPNRLGLAQWLVSGNHPLTARVRINQLWQMVFGIGLVETAEDFGTQGFPPSHPELVDWLATEFVARGWDQKAILRLIVTSNTYRQSSTLTEPLRERDPKNRLLARGPRFRVEAEMVRDIALTVSGTLSRKIGGAPVMPPQPEGMWNLPMRTLTDVWVEEKGEDRYRRGVYVIIRRTVRYPSLSVFDAPSREVTIARRDRSNSPLQSLTTLNDPAFFEAAQKLAQRLQREGGPDARTRMSYGFRLATTRLPNERELSVLVSRFEAERDRFRSNPEEAASVAGQPDAELAAWTIVSNALLNLDETLTKE